ncbi:CbtA family protein [Defluviimonas sp. SAOS-178_SWC]|uniref:CbtA family protein n=1 Tax=Defluviimonas sp. SAOS-178_SWC TaxID=3121287 RepID=UPI003221DDD2
MIQRMLAGGLIAGFAAGLLAALLHFAFIQELILLGEEYETGALVHFAGAGTAGAEVGHDHAAGEAAHDHGDGGAEGSPLGRNVLTVLFTGLTYAGYGLLLIAGFALANQLGQEVGPRDGLLWGIAGYAAFQLAPAMGLPPELPGSVAADITDRQIWYFGTVIATGAALALLAFGRGIVPAVVAGALLAAPHVIGAPHPDGYFGVAPPELAGEFAARALGVGFTAWVVLGWLAGRLWAKESV